jgi:hypothetical protein
MAEQHGTNFYEIEQFFVLYDVWWTKWYFSILDNLYLRQKVVMCLVLWETGTKICPISNIFTIKHMTYKQTGKF